MDRPVFQRVRELLAAATRRMLMAIHIGTSGWSYDHWQGIVYPRGASSLKRLDAYAEKLKTVEVNNTFYRWPADEVFARWRDRVPDDFVFSIKAARALTQYRKLTHPAEWLERMEAGVKELGDRLGMLLFQLPPHFSCNEVRLKEFLAQVPRGVPIAMEFRHPSWHVGEVFHILARHKAAYCIMSGPNKPCELRATAKQVYIRFHGPGEKKYAGSYSDDSLRWWADRISEWKAQGRSVFAYFNNDDRGYAFLNALRLRELLGA